MADIDLPVPGVTPSPEWAPMLNTAIEAVNSEISSASRNVILGLGTSITAGAVTSGVSWVNYLPGYLEAFTPGYSTTVLNGGLSGDSSSGMLSRLGGILVDRNDIGICVMEVSVNDFNSGVNLPVVDSIGNLNRMISLCQSRGITPIVIGTAPFNSSAWPVLDEARVKAVNAQVKKNCALRGVVYIDLQTKLKGSGAWTDGLHPDLEGQKAWAWAIAAGISGYSGSYALDKFERPSTTVLGTTYTGSRWVANSSGWGVDSSSRAFCGEAASGKYAVLPVDFSDQEINVTVPVVTGAGLALRVDLTAGEYSYVLNLAYGTVYKVISGTPTSLGSVATFSSGDRCRFGVKGSTLYVQRNSGAIQTISDSSIASGGYAGLYTTDSSTSGRWDDIAVIEAL